MFSTDAGGTLGEIKAIMVSGRGFTPEELAEQALNKIVFIGGNCHQFFIVLYGFTVYS